MRMSRTLLCTLLLSLLPVSAGAVNHYILDGGSGDGSSWSSAWDDLPSTFVRGDTYYVGDGTYDDHTFSTAAADSQLIIIKKATANDHGTETGWSSTYGDGQALFTASPAAFTGIFTVKTGYWVFDGVTRNEDDWSDTGAYGFAVHMAGVPAYECRLFQINKGGYNVTVQYIDFEQAGMNTNYRHDILYGFGSASNICTNVTVSRCAMHDTNRDFIGTDMASEWIVEYNEMWNLCDASAPYIHRQPISISNYSGVIPGEHWIIRYNTIRDVPISSTGSMATSVITPKDSYHSGIEIYGNIFHNVCMSNGVITDTGGDTTNNALIYNNTFSQIQGLNGISMGINFDNGSGNIAKNNIWYDCQYDTPTFSNTTHDYSAAEASLGETNGIVLTRDPFVDVANHDFFPDAGSQLLAAADTSVAALYRTDRNGVTHDAIGALAGPTVMTATVVDTLTDGADDGYVMVDFTEWITWGWTQFIYMGNTNGYVDNADFRMQLPDVPQGATITNATLYLKNKTNRPGDSRIVWSAWKTDDATAISDSTTLRTALNNNTTALVDTTITDLVVDQDILLDVTPIVQEMVDQAYWDPGDHIVFLADGSYAVIYGKWYVEDATNADGNKTKLTVTYEY